MLDSYLPTPGDSVFFSKHLMGEANKDGDVYDSVFVNFTTLDVSFYRNNFIQMFTLGSAYI